MDPLPSRRLRALNLTILGPVVLSSIVVHEQIGKVANVSTALALVVTILGSMTSYVLLVSLAYYGIENSKSLLRLYWGPLFLDGYWYYEYLLLNPDGSSHEVNRGIWKIEQSLDGLKVLGFGYTDDMQTVRTRLKSVTPIVDSNGYYEIGHEKCETTSPTVLYYAKSSLTLDRNPGRSVFKSSPIKFTAITLVYGGQQAGETHFDTFRKIEDARSEDEAVQRVRERFLWK